MQITRLRLQNWRNFRSLEVPLREITYLLGPNASGKSNFMDVFRFLRDISKPKGGGLQAALEHRGGLAKLRCLHARRDPEVQIEVEVADSPDDGQAAWRYVLGFKSEGKGAQRTLISKEEVWHQQKVLFSRPDKEDEKDPARLTQTRLEQIASNAGFRHLADFFGDITYSHLVPQWLKHAKEIGGMRLEGDPFGQGLLDRIARTPDRYREARLTKIGKALALAIPQFEKFRFCKDELGQPHLEARYRHHRPNAGWQQEEHFSDGTLRLVALLWSLLDGNSMLLLEEPEISLNDAVVKQIPLIIDSLQRQKKTKRQIIISTHSEALLDNPGIDGRGVILLETGSEGSTGRSLNLDEVGMIKDGFSVAEVILPKARPVSVERLGQWK